MNPKYRLTYCLDCDWKSEGPAADLETIGMLQALHLTAFPTHRPTYTAPYEVHHYYSCE